MCIMEIHPRQHTSTMVQAMAHNTRTITGDLEMLRELAAKRDCPTSYFADLESAYNSLTTAYNTFLHLYAACLDDAVEVDGVVGSERVAADIRNAARYETR